MLLDSFCFQYKNQPQQIAFVANDRVLTYQETYDLVQSYQYQLRCFSIENQRVAVLLDRGIDAALAILAVLMSNACYIPLDIKNPSDRLNFIIEDADVACVIGQGDCPAWLKYPDQWLDIDTLDHLTKPSFLDAPFAVNSESLAAILYTSGSSGMPKGVALSHRAIWNFVVWTANTFAVNSADRIASLAPFHFDLSVFDLFTGLSQGAAIYFVPQQLTLSPSRLTQWLDEQKITIWYTVPSILSFIALKGALSTTPLTHLHTLLFAGEVFPSPYLIKLAQALPQIKLYNLYGPTETNVCCYWAVDRTRLKETENIPIGLPAADAILHIHPDNQELWVKSANNLSGYWKQGRLYPAHNESGFYATGDKVTVNEQGEFCYLGRLDRMLKCSGYRIEPAEIETILSRCQAVEQCVVVSIQDSAQSQRPVAALVLNDAQALSEVVQWARQNLPVYMQPTKYKIFSALPYLTNGKLDLIAIQASMQ